MGYRQDKNITKELPGFRRILAHLTPTRQAASVYFQQTIDLSKTNSWIEEYNRRTGRKINILKLFMTCVGRMLNEKPRMNRYCTGTQIYQRDGVFMSVSAKKKLANDAKIVLLKVPVKAGDGFEQVEDTFNDLLGEGRSKDIRQEKEVGLFLRLPSFLLSLMIKLVNWLDRRHWLPGMFVDPDPLFTSMVVANLGSVGLDAAYHHLYEYGNCPFFAMIGKVRDEIYIENGTAKTRPVVDIKYTFDERIEDGLACAFSLAGFKEIMEDPDKFNGPLTDWGGKPPKKT